MPRNPISTIGILLLMVASSKADTLFVFTQDSCTGTCGTGPFGTVQLTQLTPMSVRVLMTLGPNSRFAGTGAGEALTFSISGSNAVTIDSLTTNFAVGPTNFQVNGVLGRFEYSVSCTTCQGSSVNNPAGPLTFRVSSTSGLVLSDFIASNRGFYFASDIVGNNGNTGNVGARAGTSYDAVPEPATLCMTGAAAILLALMRRRIKTAARV